MSQYCLSCGACCASFRVSFYWAESDAHPMGTLPQSMTQSVNPHYVCMKGTEKNPVHCVALEGKVGEQVSCNIYALRSSTCREFEAGTDECNRARAIHHLPPIPAET